MKLAIDAGELVNKIDCQGCNREWNQGHNCTIFGDKSPFHRPDECKQAEKIFSDMSDVCMTDAIRKGNCAPL